MSNPVEGIKTVLFKSALLALANNKDAEVNQLSKDLLDFLEKRAGNTDTYIAISALGLVLHKFAGILEE